MNSMKGKRGMFFSGHATQQSVKSCWMLSGSRVGFGKIPGVVREFEIGVHLHETPANAVAAANAERQKRIDNLMRQVDKLKTLINDDSRTEWV